MAVLLYNLPRQYTSASGSIIPMTCTIRWFSQPPEGHNGELRTTNLGVVMAESGLRPAKSLLNNRSRRHALKLMSLPKGDQAKTLPSGDTAMGQRMVHFSEYSGREEEIYGPTELGASISIADAEWAEQEARRADSQPRLVL